jgi:hypothetical protein
VETVLAHVTGNIGFNRHPVANLEARDPRSDRFDYARELVTRDHRIVTQVFAAQDVDIRPANTASRHLDLGFTWTRLWSWDVYHVDVIRSFDA